jgi:serine/threonine protein kinase
MLDDRYQIREPMASGRVGTMYRGFQLSVAREVAIKVIHETFASDRDAAERFVHAARLGCQLNAPSIGNVYDFGRTSDGVLYVVSELVRGRSLEGEPKQRVVTARRLVGIAMQLCDALDVAHHLGLVHGDLKPSNILIDDASGRDVVKVLDFGLARALVPETARFDPRRGLPTYAAPEQLAGGTVDARTDLYALGCILHELLAGAPPFLGASIEALAGKHRSEPPPALPPNVPAELAAIVKTLLAKSPSDRFATCKNLRARLIQVQSVVGTPPSGQPRVSTSMQASGPYVSRDPTTPPTTPPSGQHPRTTPPSGPYTRDPTTPPSIGPYTRDPTTPPSVEYVYSPDPTTPPSIGPYTRAPTTPPSLGPYNQAPYLQPEASPPAVAPPGSRRIVVIALVAIIASAAGIVLYVLATG